MISLEHKSSPRATGAIDFGDFVTGRVIRVNDWHLALPIRVASGRVIRLYPEAPNIVGIRTTDHEDVDVRVSR